MNLVVIYCEVESNTNILAHVIWTTRSSCTFPLLSVILIGYLSILFSPGSLSSHMIYFSKSWNLWAK